jgi:hypothetical protein
VISVVRLLSFFLSANSGRVPLWHCPGMLVTVCILYFLLLLFPLSQRLILVCCCRSDSCSAHNSCESGCCPDIPAFHLNWCLPLCISSLDVCPPPVPRWPALIVVTGVPATVAADMVNVCRQVFIQCFSPVLLLLVSRFIVSFHQASSYII